MVCGIFLLATSVSSTLRMPVPPLPGRVHPKTQARRSTLVRFESRLGYVIARLRANWSDAQAPGPETGDGLTRLYYLR
jgi:hypothetical protein